MVALEIQKRHEMSSKCTGAVFAGVSCASQNLQCFDEPYSSNCWHVKPVWYGSALHRALQKIAQ